MNNSLQNTLKTLRLSGMLQTLDVRLQEAAGNSLNHAEFLELILQDEMLVRKERQIKRGIKAAGFRDLKTLEDFDWQFNTSIKKSPIFDMATCRFITDGVDVLFLGPPGVGKSHLCQAIGYQAIKAGMGVRYGYDFQYTPGERQETGRLLGYWQNEQPVDLYFVNNSFDRVVLHEIPEPLTLLQLGLGGLCLLRRKR
jgi:hypothetical protein